MTTDPKKFSFSQLVSWISVAAGVGSFVADYAGLLPSKYSVPITTVTTILAGVNERLQGGKTKLEAQLATGETTKKEVVEGYKEKFPSNQ